MQAKAIAKNVGVTPRKARLVVDMVRGMPVATALDVLAQTNKAASLPVAKVIKSAAANATNNLALDGSKLVVKEIYADDAIRMKRYMPRAKGSASSIIKRKCHITVVVADE